MSSSSFFYFFPFLLLFLLVRRKLKEEDEDEEDCKLLLLFLLLLKEIQQQQQQQLTQLLKWYKHTQVISLGNEFFESFSFLFLLCSIHLDKLKTSIVIIKIIIINSYNNNNKNIIIIDLPAKEKKEGRKEVINLIRKSCYFSFVIISSYVRVVLN